MQKHLLKRTLVIGIIILFVGTILVSCVSGNIKSNNSVENIDTKFEKYTPDVKYSISQGENTWEVTPISQSQSVESFYNYNYPSGYTPFMEPYKSKIYFYIDTSTDELSLVMHHHEFIGDSIDKKIDFNFENIPSGAYVSVSDDINPPSYGEFNINLEPEGHWEHVGGSDGGVLSGLPTDETWSMLIHPDFQYGINFWTYQEETSQIQLDMTKTLSISYKLKARNVFEEECDLTKLTVAFPRNIILDNLLITNLFERFPLLERFLTLLIK